MQHAEQLTAHANSIAVRFEEEDKGERIMAREALIRKKHKRNTDPSAAEYWTEQEVPILIQVLAFLIICWTALRVMDCMILL